MRKSILTICVICAVSAVHAATIEDDFNRADMAAPSSDTSLIGANWKQSATSVDEWQVSGNYLHSHAVTTLALLYNDALETVSGNGTNFVLNTHVASKSLGSWVGLAFNYQDDDNFYVVRFKSGSNSYQLLRWVGGAVGVIQSSTAPQNFEEDAFYKITVTSDTEYTFSFSITKDAGATTLGSGFQTDANHSHTGGYAALYVGNGGYAAGHDNFSLSVNEGVLPTTPGIDDFNRADVAVTTNTVLLGGDWAQDDTWNEWTIVGGIMHSHAVTGPAVLYNNGLGSLNGVGNGFSLSVDVSSKNTSLWSGIVFNYQDADNYYGLRFQEGTSTYQLFKVVDGVLTTIVNGSNASTTFAEDTFYTLIVESDEPYNFNFSIKAAGTVVNPITSAVDDESHFMNGYAGLYTLVSGYASKYDNFALRVTYIGYAGWAQGWGVDIGEGTEDYDDDGLSNIYEYGLGGDPTNALDQGTAPEFGIENIGGTNWVGYIHPQLSDLKSGLSYYLETCTDLATGIWTNGGYTVAGTNVVVGELDFVTNVISTVEDEKFIRLIIE